MKTFLIPILIIMGLFITSSCEDKRIEYNGPWFIHFEQGDFSISESSANIISLDVTLSSPVQKDPVTVEFSLSGSAVAGIDYEMITSGKTLTFEPGVHKHTIQLKAKDNTDATGSSNLTIELVNNSAGFELGMIGEGSPKKSCKITFTDDDCPLIMADWTGVRQGHDDTQNHDGNYTVLPGSINEPNRISLIISGIWQNQLSVWSESFVTGGTATVILDNTDPIHPKVILESQYLGMTLCSTDGKNWEYWIYQQTTGTFSTCNNTFSLPYSIAYDDAYTFDPWANCHSVIHF